MLITRPSSSTVIRSVINDAHAVPGFEGVVWQVRCHVNQMKANLDERRTSISSILAESKRSRSGL